MNYLAYSGNNFLNVELPAGSTVLYAQPPMSGIRRERWAAEARRAFEKPLGMPPLKSLVDGNSRVLIAFDDNCQPFPPMARPDFREVVIGELLRMLAEYGVDRQHIHLMCAVALHRKMKPHELEYMVGTAIMKEFFPHQLTNFDAEAPEDMATLGETDAGEVVEISRHATEADLIIYVDSVQIPLNGGHKSVGVGLAGYRTIAYHHSPHATADNPHVMQPHGSEMHKSIWRIGRLIEQHCRIMVIEFAMNADTYPPHVAYIGKPPERCNFVEKVLRSSTPLAMKLLPEAGRRSILRSVASAYAPLSIEAGSIESVHDVTLAKLRQQLTVQVPRQYDTLVFGLPDLSPYAMDARVNPVLVVSDVLGYVFNWFYNKPLVKPGGTVIILNPVDEVFHSEYHVAYQRFYDEVLGTTKDPFEMQRVFQEKYALDEDMRQAYRHRFAHHGFHPFTVWYWATYPLKYLSQVILVGPKDDRQARRLGVQWAPNMNEALRMARGRSDKDDVVAVTIPPFLYVDVKS